MTSPVRDIDNGWAWFVLLASYFNLLMCSGLAYIAGVFQLVFLEQFQGSVSLTSWVTALFSSLMQLGGPLSSLLCNWFSCRTAVMAGGFCMSVGLFVSSMANSLEMLFITFGVLAGAGIGLAYTASIVVLNYFFVERRTLVNGLALSASGLGILISPQISLYLFNTFSWRETLVIMSGAAAQICVTGALMISTHEKKGTLWGQRCFSCISWCYNDTKESKEDSCVIIDKTARDIEEIVYFENNEDLEVTCNCASGERRYLQPEVKDNLLSPKVRNDQCMCQRKSIEYPSPSIDSTDQQQNESTSTHNIMINDLAIDVTPKPRSSSLVVRGSRNGSVHTGTKPLLSGSHQDITLRIRAMKQAANSHSHPELSASHDGTSFVFADPKSIQRLDYSRSESGGANTSDVVVIMRNASLLGVAPSLSSLELIASPTRELRDNASCLSSSQNMLENTVIVSKLGTSFKRTIPVNSDKGKKEDLADIDTESEIVSAPRIFPPLYRNTHFWVLCASLFIENCGCGIFTIHFPSLIRKNGLPIDQLTNLLSVYGLALLIARCFCGALANAMKGNDLIIWWSVHVLGGLCVIFMPLAGSSYITLVVLVYGMGNFYGSAYAVLTTMTIEMVGLTGLATAFGVEMVCAGLGFFVSPPLAGIVVDLTNNYDYSLYSAGSLIVIGGMVILILPLLRPDHRSSRDTSDDVIHDPIQSHHSQQLPECEDNRTTCESDQD